MANNNKSKIKLPDAKLVIILKLISLLVILLVPITFILIDLSRSFLLFQGLSKKQPTASNLNQAPKPGSEFNVQVSLPPEQMGSLSNVSKEKIDTLFSNLKK
jgi:hypothetical protein